MKVISFSLFGVNGPPAPLYTAGAVANALICADLYSDFVCRFYVGDSVTAEVRRMLFGFPNVQIVPMVNRPEDWSALMWRFYSLLDAEVDVHLFRDVDSRPDERERAAVEEWLRSGLDFHVMRDHPEHCMPIMAGMWGCTAVGARKIAPLLPAGGGKSRFTDQLWLRDAVYPGAAGSMLVHDDMRWLDGEDPQPFPVARQPLGVLPGWRFVGQAFDEDDMPRLPADALRISAGVG
jgi:hypothetical protein